MKCFSILVALVLSALTLATHIDNGWDDDSPAVAARGALSPRRGIWRPRKNQFCDIVRVKTEVDCWRLPQHGGAGNRKVKSLKGTRMNVEFSCYVDCENVGGNKSWDYAVNHKCYIPGYYTDRSCSRKRLGKCPWYKKDKC
ncbi:hypothetical protein GX51_01858 [Blastomyces parvus]|uniref:Uncharacterized protein n=1 Tax=Blastomyces parvus TaxID=2060905 RepID=A0A2B7X6M8_9EURO|nr:hypothetical protein GX51_01858 [Blastomyces parvus]